MDNTETTFGVDQEKELLYTICNQRYEDAMSIMRIFDVNFEDLLKKYGYWQVGMKSINDFKGYKGGDRLYLEVKGVSKIPNILPTMTRWLHCENGDLIELPETLPRNLRGLYVKNNKLTYLPKNLPSKLEILHCYGNNIKDFSNVPDSCKIINEPTEKLDKNKAIRVFNDINKNLYDIYPHTNPDKIDGDNMKKYVQKRNED